jgi:hypothetical protein
VEEEGIYCGLWYEDEHSACRSSEGKDRLFGEGPFLAKQVLGVGGVILVSVQLKWMFP